MKRILVVACILLMLIACIPEKYQDARYDCEVTEKEIHSYTTTTYTKIGDVRVPITTNHTDYKLSFNCETFSDILFISSSLYNNIETGQKICISNYEVFPTRCVDLGK